jgi:hypothetical protein
MANNMALSTLFIKGLRERELANKLASNAALDWFGRTISGKENIVKFYLNSNNCYEHSMRPAEIAEPFEERSAHLLT